MKTWTLLALIGLLAACGCGDKPRDVALEKKANENKREEKDPQPSENKRDEDKKAPQPSENKKDTEKKDKPAGEGWGTVKGTITYEKNAKLPDNPEVNVTNDKMFCLAKGKILRDEWVVEPKTRGIKNVIVWLSDEDAAKAQNTDWDAKLIHKDYKEVPKELVLDQPVCSFMPRVIALREGTKLTFKNSATVAHNVKIDGGDLGPRINTAIPPGKSISEDTIKARFLPTEVACTIHPWMKCWLISFEHPYYAVTDEKGNFEIKNAPAGKYRLQIWHEGYGFVQKNKNDRGEIITIRDGRDTKFAKELVKED